MWSHLFNGLPLEGVVLADYPVRHADEVLAELLNVGVAAVAPGEGGVGRRRQQLDEGQHVGGLQVLPPGLLQRLPRHLQQSRRLARLQGTERLLSHPNLQGPLEETYLYDLIGGRMDYRPVVLT